MKSFQKDYNTTGVAMDINAEAVAKRKCKEGVQDKGSIVNKVNIYYPVIPLQATDTT